MDTNKMENRQKNRFLKLSLKKNREQKDCETDNLSSRNSDLIILDESFDRLISEFDKNTRKIYSPIVIDDSSGFSNDSEQSKIQMQKSGRSKTGNTQKICSPIVLDDSSDFSNDTELPKTSIPKPGPSKTGNVSFNGSQGNSSIVEVKDSKPNLDECWSPPQEIVCATPRDHTVPSTPKDVVNESSEKCTIKTIEKSQKKLLTELYGEIWKSIPTLFKTKSNTDSNHVSGCAKKLDFLDESDKEINIRKLNMHNKELYLTGSDAKRKVRANDSLSEKKSKKKLYTEIVPSTPQPARTKSAKRDANSTTKKLKGKSVTELVHIMKDKFEVDSLAKKVEDVCITPANKINTNIPDSVKRLSFIGSLADNVPGWRLDPEAYEYMDNFKGTKEKLTRRLFEEFNKNVFQGGLDADMVLEWDTKLRSTAGLTTNRGIKKPDGTRLRSSSIKLSVKVVDGPQRLRDTLIHELCHSATWVIDQELKAGHGPLWKKWAHHAVKVYPELGTISRCHDLDIHFKYTYKCTQCGYSIERHSKSLDILSKCCGYCRGKFEIFVNRKNKDGVVVSTPARHREAGDFALYVKENYKKIGQKDGKKTHAQVMKLLGEQFSSKKKGATS